MKLRKLIIKKYKIFRDFELDFTNNGSVQNLVVLAGVNGSGKTTILRDVVYEFFANHRINGDAVVSFEHIKERTNEIEVLDFDLHSLDAANQVNTNSYISLNYPKTFYIKAGEVNEKQANDVILQFIDRLIYQQDKKSSEAYKVVQGILDSLFVDFDMQIDFNGVSQTREIYFQNKENKQIHIEELSSGEQELITKCFSLYLAEIKDSIILVDEPEGSMHPNWQNRIVGIYQKIANENNNQIILATHSPHVVSSVNKEQIRVLVKEDDKIKAIQNFSGSYGWRVDKILLEIFRTTTVRTPLVEKEINTLKKLVVSGEYNSEDFRARVSNLEKVLGYDDVDLTMLRFEIELKKKTNEKNK